MLLPVWRICMVIKACLFKNIDYAMEIGYFRRDISTTRTNIGV